MAELLMGDAMTDAQTLAARARELAESIYGAFPGWGDAQAVLYNAADALELAERGKAHNFKVGKQLRRERDVALAVIDAAPHSFLCLGTESPSGPCSDHCWKAALRADTDGAA